MRRRRRASGAYQADLPPVFESYREWMRCHRGIAEETLQHYGHMLRKAFAALGDDPGGWTARGLRDFVLALAGRSSHAQARNAVAAIRSFVRYATAEGLAQAGLEAAVPTLAGWRGSDLPRYLPAQDVERIVAACDARTAMGARDRAIVLLLARLGLRAGEVAQLGFEDIDWGEGTIRVMGKGRREARLPLPQEVGDAILAYLRKGRSRVPVSQVFLTCGAGRGQPRPLRRSSLSNIVRRAIDRTGVDAPHRGAHVLRHSLATAMLRSGASLQAIGALLRHRSLETTAHYAKVDLALLRQVAQPWPEVATW